MLLQITDPYISRPEKQPAVGIDLGTTHSVVAYAREGKVKALYDKEGRATIPSVVAYSLSEQPLVGYPAQQQLASHPDKVISSVKRLMGRSRSDIENLLNNYPSIYPSQDIRLHVADILKTPIEVSADILKVLKQRAEQVLKQPVMQAVITVPAYFDDAARLATKQAAQLAGLQVLRLINEPTAAALAYGLDQAAEGIYAVYDLGGGTFDISILKLTRGVFQVLATGGNTALGGDDIDITIADYFLSKILPQTEISPALYRRVLMIARQAKEYLSYHKTSTWTLAELKTKAYLDRPTLEHLSTPLIERTLLICHHVLNDAALVPEAIKGIILVGGSTRMPLVKQALAKFFPNPILDCVNPDEVVALGAALQAEALTRGSNALLLDVAPLSLGIEIMGNLVEKIIPRNTPIPVAFKQEFTTHYDGQTAIRIHVVQGESEQVHHCRSLGEFVLTGIPAMPAGKVRVEITLTLDADGLLTVSGREKISNIQQKIEVKPSYGLSEEDLQRILLQQTDKEGPSKEC